MSTVYSVPVEVKLALAFMVIDVFTGVLKAVKNKELNSTKAREGIYKNYVDMGFNFPAAATICTLIIVTEAISILENLGQINPDLVKLVAPFLSALNKKEDGEHIEH